MKSIFKLDYGKAFKGHAMELVHTDNLMVLTNRYFNNVVTAVYNTNKNITTRDYTYYPINAKIPKWYQELEKRLEALALPTRMMLRRDNYTCTFYTGTQVIFNHFKKYDGINFNNHCENINYFGKMRHRFSIIRENVKQLTDEDLHSFEIKTDDLHELALAGNRVLVLPEDIFYK